MSLVPLGSLGVVASSDPSGDQATFETGPLTPAFDQVGRLTGPAGAGVVASGPRGTELPQAVPAGIEGRRVTGDWLAAIDAAGLGDAGPAVGPAVAAARVELEIEGPQPVRPALIIARTTQRPTDRIAAAYIGFSTSSDPRGPA